MNDYIKEKFIKSIIEVNTNYRKNQQSENKFLRITIIIIIIGLGILYYKCIL